MQLDVGVSPPANIMTFRPGLTYLTFDLEHLEMFDYDVFRAAFLKAALTISLRAIPFKSRLNL